VSIKALARGFHFPTACLRLLRDFRAYIHLCGGFLFFQQHDSDLETSVGTFFLFFLDMDKGLIFALKKLQPNNYKSLAALATLF
jgi:hypothetical protein